MSAAHGAIDRIGGGGAPDEAALLFGDHAQRRIAPLVYYSYKTAHKPVGGSGEDEDATVTIGAGLLFGLNENTPGATLKWPVEAEF